MLNNRIFREPQVNSASPTAPASLEVALIGQPLEAGWTIRALRDEVSSGPIRIPTLSFLGTNPKDERALVRVLDLRVDPATPDALKDLEMRLQVFNYQKDLIERLADERLHGIVRGLHSGSILFATAPLGRVYYLIVEWSDDDLRSQVALHEHFDASYALRVLHQAANALHELHLRNVAHQSVRPANVVFLDQRAKLGEFSCAVDGHKPRPDGAPTLDWTSAPPEILYQVAVESMDSRCLVDIYQLGSLICYLFSGTSLTTQLGQQLQPIHHWKHWTGSFPEALPYVHHAFSDVLRELGPHFPEPCRSELLKAVSELCAPDPAYRGHPSNRAGQGPQYSTERYMSLFDRLASRLERGLPRRLG